jgi:hypothetical protein
VKSYPGTAWLAATPVCARAKQEIDYGLRGKGYVYGAWQPSTGQVQTACYPARNSSSYVDFLGQVEAALEPTVEHIYAIVDNLQAHHGRDAQLFTLSHPRWEFIFQPKYAAYLNLIEPWWKSLRSLALRGRRFTAWPEITAAVVAGTGYWNEHKHPFKWGERRRHRRCRPAGIALTPNV